ncbi:MAG TPA: VCBS repeat-containing protein, partial [Terriglobales bacterium]|nr:VCBS repeat-containing protein [Terriglobales bacterium]
MRQHIQRATCASVALAIALTLSASRAGATTSDDCNRNGILDRDEIARREPITSTSQPISNIDRMELIDVDGDGDRDLAAFYNFSGGALTIWRNDGSGTFARGPVVSLPFSFSSSQQFADLTSDQRPDLLQIASTFSSGTGSTTRLQVFRNDGSGTFVAGEIQASPVHSSQLAIGDVDGDGDLDAAIGGSTSLQGDYGIVIAHNDGNGAFTFGDVMPTDEPIGSSVLGDVDNDGLVDLVALAGDFGDSAVLVFAGTADGGFAEPDRIPSDGRLFQLSLANLDGDGYLDAFVGDGYLRNVGSPNPSPFRPLPNELDAGTA